MYIDCLYVFLNQTSFQWLDVGKFTKSLRKGDQTDFGFSTCLIDGKSCLSSFDKSLFDFPKEAGCFFQTRQTLQTYFTKKTEHLPAAEKIHGKDFLPQIDIIVQELFTCINVSIQRGDVAVTFVSKCLFLFNCVFHSW